MKLNPYLTFDGTCAEAFAFYADVLGGKIVMQMSYAEAPPDAAMPGADPGRMMHMRIEAGGGVLMGSDAPPGMASKPAGFSVSLNFEDLAEAEEVFGRLSEGGKVMMPLGKTFWARGFAMFVDRFGTPWMINCE